MRTTRDSWLAVSLPEHRYAIVSPPSELLERLTAQIVPFLATLPGVGLFLWYLAELELARRGCETDEPTLCLMVCLSCESSGFLKY